MDAVNYSQDEARRLFELGGFVLVLGVEEGCEVGIDRAAYTVKRDFMGFKFVPPGAHLLTLRVYNQAAAQFANNLSGTVFWVAEGDFLVFRYAKATETLCLLEKEDEDVARLRAHKYEIDLRLAAYDLRLYFNEWVPLTCHLTKQSLDRVVPLSTAGHLNPRFLQLSKRITGAELSSSIETAALTADNLDRSAYLIREVSSAYGSKSNNARDAGRTILAEICLSYILFVALESLDALVHWKLLVYNLSMAGVLLGGAEGLLDDFVGLLLVHLETFLGLDLHDENVMIGQTHVLFRATENLLYLSEQSLGGRRVQRKTRAKIANLRRKLEAKYGWDFDMMDPDELPVVVSLSDSFY